MYCLKIDEETREQGCALTAFEISCNESFIACTFTSMTTSSKTELASIGVHP